MHNEEELEQEIAKTIQQYLTGDKVYEYREGPVSFVSLTGLMFTIGHWFNDQEIYADFVADLGGTPWSESSMPKTTEGLLVGLYDAIGSCAEQLEIMFEQGANEESIALLESQIGILTFNLMSRMVCHTDMPIPAEMPSLCDALMALVEETYFGAGALRLYGCRMNREELVAQFADQLDNDEFWRMGE